MKKQDLKKLALLGVTSGLLVANQSFAETDSNGFVPYSAEHKCPAKNGCPQGKSSCKGGCGTAKAGLGTTLASCGSSCKALTADLDEPEQKPPYQDPEQEKKKTTRMREI